MSTPLTADQLVKALKDEGVKVVEYKSWRTHNRNHVGAWGPVHGVMIHHTAGTNSLALCYSGRSDLPGPLCHTHLSKAGLASMVGHGRANHAGSIAQNAHAAVVAESSTHPRPDADEPVDGNRHYYGLEIENLGTGRDPYPEVQYDQAVRWAAAICRAHRWGANSVIGHKEATRRKIDPSFDMDAFRRDVAERLRHPAGWSPTDDNPEQENDMALTDADIEKIAARVWQKDGVIAPPWATEQNPHWAAESVITDTGNILREVRGRVKGMEAQLAALNTTVRTLAEALAARDNAVDADALVARIEERITQAVEGLTVRLDVTP